MTQLLTISDIGGTAVTATQEARAKRDELVLLAKGLTTVATVEDATRAATILRDLKGFTRLLEDARTTVKGPVLDLGKKIDALAKHLTVEVDTEATRVSRILGTWQAEQNRIAEEARKRAWEEEQRIREEAARQEREAAERERERQAELARKESVARSDAKAQEYRQQAEAAALRARQDEQRRDMATEQAIISTRVNASAVAAPKQAGIATREEIKFEVENITALYEAAPYLVTLLPNAAAIKNALKGLSAGQKLPGVRHWKEALTVVR